MEEGETPGAVRKASRSVCFSCFVFFLRSAIAGSHGTMRANRKKTRKKMKRQNGIFAWLRDEKRVAIHADCFRACLSMCARSWVDVIGTPLNMVCRSAPVVHLVYFFFSGRICCRGLRSPPWLLLFRPQSSPITSRELRKEETEREPRNVRRVPGAMMAARTSRIGAFPLGVLSSTVYEVCSLGSTVQSRVCFYK